MTVALSELMRQQFVSFALVILVAALTVACSQSATSPTSPSAIAAPPSAAHTIAQLEGTWTLASLQLPGEAKQDRPSNATYTLSFSEGRLSTRVDCNSCGGSYSIEGTTLTAGPNLACTRAACPTMAFENNYTSILGGSSTIAVNGSTLTVTSSRGTLQLVRN